MEQMLTVYSVLQECYRSLLGTFTQRDLLLWVQRRYPSVRESTLRAHVQALTSNATNRKRNHPVLGSVRRSSIACPMGFTEGTQANLPAPVPPTPHPHRSRRSVDIARPRATCWSAPIVVTRSSCPRRCCAG